MSWARFDDGMGEHRKVKRAIRAGGLGVFGLHALAILHCSKYLTDGFVEDEFVAELGDLVVARKRDRDQLVTTLCQNGLWTQVEGGWQIHDYLDHNPSREQVIARREADAQRKSHGRNSRDVKAAHRSTSTRTAAGQTADGAGTDTGVQAESVRPVPSRPIPVPSLPPGGPPVGGGGGDPTTSKDLFEYWRLKCGHPGAKFTADKRQKIEARLRDGYTPDQIRQAIDGAARAAYVNETSGKRYDAITLICRTGTYVEDFMERATEAKPKAEQDQRALIAALAGRQAA